jgi:hypothetical protein
MITDMVLVATFVAVKDWCLFVETWLDTSMQVRVAFWRVERVEMVKRF